MKKMFLVCLLGMCAAAAAQTEPVKRGGKAAEVAELERSDAELAKERAKREEEEAKTRAKLDEARQRLDKAAREVAELSTQLGARERRDVLFFRNGMPEMGERRAMLGVQIDPQSGKEGARVQSVSPGGPAADAGLATGDVIVLLDGKSIAGSANSYRTLVDKMREVTPDQKVKVRVLRAGKNKDLIVVARPMVFTTAIRGMRGPGDDGGFLAGAFASDASGMHVNPFPGMQRFHAMFPGEFGGMELASITPKLGAYFGTNEGVLVVQAPENDAFKLEDGDVIQSIDGRKPEDGAHALRILRSYKPGEKLNLSVLRQRKAVTLGITMPERPEFMEHFSVPPVPAVPPVPPVSMMAPMPMPTPTPGTLE